MKKKPFWYLGYAMGLAFIMIMVLVILAMLKEMALWAIGILIK